VAVVYRIWFWSAIPPDIWIYLEWISFHFQPVTDPDYLNERKCGHAKNFQME